MEPVVPLLICLLSLASGETVIPAAHDSIKGDPVSAPVTRTAERSNVHEHHTNPSRTKAGKTLRIVDAHGDILVPGQDKVVEEQTQFVVKEGGRVEVRQVERSEP